MPGDKNLTATQSQVSAGDRAQILGQAGAVLWLTGLSGSGKSTLAYAVERKLVDMGRLAFVLDGDNLRLGLSSDLAFSQEDRSENIRRVGEVATLLSQTGMFVLTSFISPYRKDRDAVRAKVESAFVEVYLDVPLQVCEERDPKKLYHKARSGQIADFTGISAPYEEPTQPELRINTAEQSVDECVDTIVSYLQEQGLLQAAASKNERAQGQPQ